MRITPIRREVLDILSKENKPISAKTIKEKFNLLADLSNIYRNLNTLELDGAIGSISFQGRKY